MIDLRTFIVAAILSVSFRDWHASSKNNISTTEPRAGGCSLPCAMFMHRKKRCRTLTLLAIKLNLNKIWLSVEIVGICLSCASSIMRLKKKKNQLMTLLI